MDIQKRSTGFGAALIIFAVLLRLIDGALAVPTHASRPEQTGNLRLPVSGISASTATPALPPVSTQPPPTTLPPLATQPTIPSTTQPTAPTTIPTMPPTVAPTEPALPARLTFTAADADYLRLRAASDCGYDPELLPLLLQELNWQLDSGEPTVLIYHSHGSESYAKQPQQDYTEYTHCRTTDTDYNMVAVGDALAQLLTDAGITVIHDRQIHDYPSYNQSYVNSGRAVRDYLAQYPSIRLVLDLHRDAAVGTDGGDYASFVEIDGEAAAQFMFVIGTDYEGNYHPNWRENLALACKLQVLLEQQVPGITRRGSLRGGRFNQNLSTGALLIEVGATGNTLEQVYRSLPYLANAIAALANGAEGT